MSEWRTIESAPKDGTRILMYLPIAKPVLWPGDRWRWGGEIVVAIWAPLHVNGEMMWHFEETACQTDIGMRWQPLPDPPTT